MKLIQNEEKLFSLGDNITLTNYRIIQEEKTFGKAYSMFIFLEDISSIENRYKSNVWFLIIGITLLLSSLFFFIINKDETTSIGLLLLGLVSILIW